MSEGGIAVDQACQALPGFVALPLDRGAFRFLLAADGQSLPSQLGGERAARSTRAVGRF